MWVFYLVSISLFLCITAEEKQDPVLYYYGLDESERSLPLCEARQACSAVLQRYWLPPALVRLCRCPRRQRCDIIVPSDRRIELNNRAYFQFCKPAKDWPQCSIDDLPLTVETLYDRIDPNQMEDFHHNNIQLSPPKIVFKCQCQYPKYWKLVNATESEDVQTYQCASLPYCKTGEYCGNISNDLYALYQSCLCPKRHICVHGGGLPQTNISELLYRGKGWKAYCERIGEEYSYEEY